MTKVKAKFIRVNIKDVCRNLPIGVTVKVVSAIVMLILQNMFFFDSRIKSLLLGKMFCF
jgi:hypothetical protein